MHIPKIILSFLPAICQSAEWTYTQSWDELGQCNGNSQSPIDIISNDSTQKSSEMDPLQAAAFVEQISSGIHQVELQDPTTGHALKYSFKPEIRSSSLKCPQFHLHIQNSEHTINGQFSFAEIHVVCYKNHFKDLTAAITHGAAGNLAVFGFMVDVGGARSRGDPRVQDIIDQTGSLEDYYSNPDLIPNLSFKLQIPRPANLDHYYRYQGSLTTPTCNEVVTWTVFQDPIRISPMQKAKIFSVGDNLKYNNRPVQALNGREVTFFHPPSQFSQAAFFNQGYGTNQVYGQNYHVGQNSWAPISRRPVQTYQNRPYVRPQGQRNQNSFWLWYLLARG